MDIMTSIIPIYLSGAVVFVACIYLGIICLKQLKNCEKGEIIDKLICIFGSVFIIGIGVLFLFCMTKSAELVKEIHAAFYPEW